MAAAAWLLVCTPATAADAAPGATRATPVTTPKAPTTKPLAPAIKIKLVDINSAKRDELMTLPGIGAAEADRIVAARPYLSKAKLVVAQVVSIDVYRGLKGRIVAIQKSEPKVKPASKVSGKTGDRFFCCEFFVFREEDQAAAAVA